MSQKPANHTAGISPKWGALLAVITVLAAYSLTVGYVYPAVAFNLKIREFSPGLIGMQSAMSGIGILIGALFTAMIAARYTAFLTTVVGLVASALAIVAIGIIPPIAWWFLLRFIIGFTGSMVFIVTETWINQLAPDRLRGQIIGIYTSVLAGVFAFGPWLTSVLGFDGWRPYFLVALMLLAMGIPLLIFRRDMPPAPPHEPGAFVSTFRLIPVLMLGVAAFGFFDGAVLTLWPVYAIDSNATADHAALLLSTLIVGNLVFQYPIGWLADHFSRRSLFTLCATVAFFGSVMLPLTDLNQTYIYPYLLLWGALSFGIYTLAMTIVGEVLKGPQLVAANAGFGVMWGAGAIGGSAISGWLMDVLGPAGLPVALGIMFGILTITSLFFPPIRIKQPAH
ncbi:MAG: MFS transporter [Hyphomicrobiaceae bacterium]